MIYFDNAYRTLGTYADIARPEARSLLQRMKVRSRMATAEATDDPLHAIAPVERNEDAVRDAFNTLGNLRTRLEHRLLWFTNRTSRDLYALKCVADGDYRGAVETWGATDDIAARANLARLYHALMIARDLWGGEGSVHAHSYGWHDVVRSWTSVSSDERFWRELALADAASGFEPAAFGQDIAALRKDLWMILLGPSVELMTLRTRQGAYDRARAHLDDLEVGGLAPNLIALLEREGFSPFFSALDAAIDDVAAETAAENESKGPTAAVRVGHKAYRTRVVPLLREMLRLAGFNFEPSKLACRKASDCLGELVALALAAENNGLANMLYAEAQMVLGGEIADETNPAAYGPGGGGRERSTFEKRMHRIPWWVYSIGVLFCYIMVFALKGDPSTSSSTSTTIQRLIRDQQEYQRRNPIDVSGLDSVEMPAMSDSLYTSIDDSVRLIIDKARRIVSLSERLADGHKSLEGYEKRIAMTVKGLQHLDSLDRFATNGDTAQRSILARTSKQWKQRLDILWNDFDKLYEEYGDSLKAYNRLTARPKKDTMGMRSQERTEHPDLRDLYRRVKGEVTRWKRISVVPCFRQRTLYST